MTSLPDHDALLDGIANAQRSRNSSKSPRSSRTPPLIDLKHQRYPVLPAITGSSDQCSDERINKGDEGEVISQQCATPLPGIQQQPSHTVHSMATMMGSNPNFMSAGIPVLPVMLPWQHAQVSHAGLFGAHHNTVGNMQNVNNRNTTKREPWFKKFKYRPMSENRAAVVIQKHFRGYLTRRNLEFQQYLANRWLASRLVDKIIDETLRDDMIPDMLIELLQERMKCGGWFTDDAEHQAHMQVSSLLINEVISELLPVYVKESNHELVIGYLHEHGVHREPLVHIVKSLVDEAVNELVRDEVERYISDTLQSYFTESQAVLLTNTLLEDIIDEKYLSQLAVETLIEHICDSFYDDVVQQELLVIVKECLTEGWARGDWAAASVSVSPVLDEMMLRILLSHVAHQGSVLDMQYYSDSVMSEMILRVCLLQIMSIHEREVNTQDNVMLRQLHQRILQEMAFDVLLEAWSDLWN